jgi:2-furoyl-CoA dehydrogenase FAD binding subunit
MKPGLYDYYRCDTVDEVLELLARCGDDARILAGGQSLMAALNMRLAQPKVVIDISRIAPLAYARVANDALVIGASATQGSVEWRPTLGAEVPLLKLAFPYISHFQIRNRGTVCGSIAHADPSAELPVVLLALGGRVGLRSRQGRRELSADAFAQGMLMTARRPDELVEDVSYPVHREGTRYAFAEMAQRHGDFAIAALAACVDADGIRLAVGGVSDRPRLLNIERLSGSALDDALNDFAWSLEAQDDQHASAQYRRHLVRRLGRRVIQEASA